MLRPFLISTTWVATLAVIIGSVSLSAGDRSRSRQFDKEAVEEASSVVKYGRVHLAATQIKQTRDPGQWPEEIRSLLNVDHKLHHGEWLWDDRGVPLGRPTIRIDLGQQLISVFRNGHEIGTAMILYGANSHETPLGRFPILSKTVNHRSRKYDAPMPYALWLTEDGVALHGSKVRSGSATHGCIGLPIGFARHLFEQAQRGDKVLILRSRTSQ